MRRKHVYTIKEMARAVGYSRQTVWELVNEGKLIACYRSEKLILFSSQERDKFVNSVLFKGKYDRWRHRLAKNPPDHPIPPTVRIIS